ncbi:MAG: hypothetical protein HY240_01710 [Actinobacteria bacterium]|nr:hypothetical protein [Actinomycetota bacterium]
MAKMIQVRNVRPGLHAELMRRARLRGKTLTAYIEDILEREAGREDPLEVFSRIKSRRPIPLDRPAAEDVREGREEREQGWDRSLSTPRP